MAKNSIFRKLTIGINRIYTKALSCGIKLMIQKNYSKLLKRHPHPAFSSEKEYKKLWSPLTKNPDNSTYRLFSQYIGEEPAIAPETVIANIIQPLLNPIEYRPYYRDKNAFDKILGADFLPTTLLRSMEGSLLDASYNSIVNPETTLAEINRTESRVFLKPTVDSSSGQGVVGFERGDDGVLRKFGDGIVLDKTFIDKYKAQNPNFILQRALTQHPEVSLFNPTSINTIRIATYRSVVDNKPHFLRAIIRIGKAGSIVDNAHSGGLFVGVDETGTLGKYACDQYGNRYDKFNGVNFKDNTYTIPNFDKVIKFSEEIAKKVLHARLLAQDICIEENGEPKLVEFNIGAFSAWLFQFTSGTAFGEYTQEIIDYCKTRKENISKVFVEPF